MKEQQAQLEKWIGQPIALYTRDGIEVGLLDSVTDKGVRLRPLPKQDRNGLDLEHVFFGGGFYPWGGLGGFGLGAGIGALGLGAGLGAGLGGLGGGFYRPFYGGYRGFGYRPYGGFVW